MAGEAEKILKNVVSLADVLENGSLQSVELMLLDASRRAALELPHVKKAIVIFFDEGQPVDEEIKWSQAGLTRREILRVLSLARDEIMLDNAMLHTHE